MKIIRVHWVGAAALWEDTKGKIHATQKPVDLYRKVLQLCANDGDLIFDSHVGSGSSLIACEDLGFDYIGFEKKESIFNDSNQRLINYRSQPKFGFVADMNKELIQQSMF